MKAAAFILVAWTWFGWFRHAPEPIKPAPAQAEAPRREDTVKVTSGPFKGTVAGEPKALATPAPMPPATPAPMPPAPSTPVPTIPVSTRPVFPAPKHGLQTTRWNAAKVNAKDLMRLDKMVAFYQRNRDTYEKLEKMRSNGVPAPIICCFHMRESDNSFARHLHEGSLLTHRTVDEPKGRLPHPLDPPYTFIVSAEDALYTYEKLERRDWQHLETALQAAESYNGLGYQKRGRVSPYMWAATSIYTGGKYVKDGVFSATAYDQQLGLCSVLLRMRDRGIPVNFQ